MTIETDLYSTLSNDSGVTALCSTRISPNMAREGTALPYIVYAVVTGSNINTITGVGDMQRKRIQLDCNAATYTAAKNLAAAVIAALEGNGYKEFEFEQYDPETQVHTVFVDWAFLA